MKKNIHSTFAIIVLLLSYLNIYAQNGKVGINTENPQSTLDINGDLTIRSTPNFDSGMLSELGVNQNGQVLKKNQFSYNVYLGLSPLAATQNINLPLALDDNYITRITGTSIGACYGVIVNFEILFIGKTYLGAKLQGISTDNTTTYSKITLSNNQTIFGKSLELLAKASTRCSDPNGLYGHTLTYNSTTGIINVKYYDVPTYYPSAGTFVIYSFDRYLRN